MSTTPKTTYLKEAQWFNDMYERTHVTKIYVQKQTHTHAHKYTNTHVTVTHCETGYWRSLDLSQSERIWMVPGTDVHFSCTPTSSHVRRLFMSFLVSSCIVPNAFVTRTKQEFDFGVNSAFVSLRWEHLHLNLGQEDVKFSVSHCSRLLNKS